MMSFTLFSSVPGKRPPDFQPIQCVVRTSGSPAGLTGLHAASRSPSWPRINAEPGRALPANPALTRPRRVLVLSIHGPGRRRQLNKVVLAPLQNGYNDAVVVHAKFQELNLQILFLVNRHDLFIWLRQRNRESPRAVKRSPESGLIFLLCARRTEIQRVRNGG